MLYLHDIWVNWFENEENGYQVAYFHEWRKEDNIELLDRAPLLYIRGDLFDYIENDLQEIPTSLLEMIYKQAYTKKNQVRTEMDYACVITNGTEVLAIDTIGYTIPIRKSRLVPRQEALVFDMIKDEEEQHFGFKQRHYFKEYKPLSLPPEFMVGLTRREREIKQILLLAVDQLRTADNLEELRYWLTEWNPKQYPAIREMNENDVWQKLYDGVKEGYSDSHEDFCEKVVRGQPYLEKLWSLESQYTQGTSKT